MAKKKSPETDPKEQLAKIIREHDLNQMIVAFTAMPAPATVTLFGESFDTYSEAIAEGYVVDVAVSVISYKTIYNLHCPVVQLSGFFLQRRVPACCSNFTTLASASRVRRNSLSHVTGTMDLGATLSNAQ